ncbi:MAG: DHH family phosphoesterase [Nanoarchaeota archaeon]
MSWKRFVSRIKEFIKGIKPDSRVAIVCDSDPDGICSAVIVSHSLKKKGIIPALVIPSGHNVEVMDGQFVTMLKKEAITHLITTDLSFDKKKRELKRLEKFCQILVIDHHKLYNDVNSKRIILLKPQLFQNKIDSSQYCTSKLAFDMFSELTDLKEYDWLAVIGILADSNFRTWKKFVRKTLNRLGLKLGKHPFQNALGRICNLMAYYEIYAPGKVAKLYDALSKAITYRHALNSEIKKAQKVNDEVEYYLKNYKRHSQVHGDLLLIRIKPNFKIGSIVATRLSNKLEHTTIVIAQEMKGRMFVSARRQDFKVAVNDLLEQSVKEIKEASAGGHIPAAGARFPTEQYDTFSERIIAKTRKPNN